MIIPTKTSRLAGKEKDMNVNVSGRNVDIGQPLRTHITDRLKAASDKYFDHSIKAAVTISRQGPFVSTVA